MERHPFPEMASETNDNTPSPGARSITWDVTTQCFVVNTANPSCAALLAICRSDAAAHGLVTDPLGYEQVVLVGIREEISDYVGRGYHLKALRYALEYAFITPARAPDPSFFQGDREQRHSYGGQYEVLDRRTDPQPHIAVHRYYEDSIFPQTIWFVQDEADNKPTRQIPPWILEYVDPLDNYSNQAYRSINDQTNAFAALENLFDEEEESSMAEEDYEDLEEQFLVLPMV
ncbi:hypothetical protein E0Z10_g9584 [Xylaria hypoxylon]|uniref:Uncharacterized protein n=1 Tax=Xylaria hypoxylon TaxID=37992 RepID=A0A4Z0YIS6_9PEZI|nr:hypothetical protein E0Z10_g9584 [Xylaria hypoxylon]